MVNDEQIRMYKYRSIDLEVSDLRSKVWRQSFWMRAYGAPTAKRSCLWSNSRGVRFFAHRKMGADMLRTNHKLALKKYTRSGKKIYSGNRANLKKSQLLDIFITHAYACTCHGIPSPSEALHIPGNTRCASACGSCGRSKHSSASVKTRRPVRARQVRSGCGFMHAWPLNAHALRHLCWFRPRLELKIYWIPWPRSTAQVSYFVICGMMLKCPRFTGTFAIQKMYSLQHVGKACLTFKTPYCLRMCLARIL